MTSTPAPSPSDLTIIDIRRWLVRVPVNKPMVWGSGARTGVTRVIVELTTAGGVTGWGESICLLDAIPAVLDRIVMPVAMGKQVFSPANVGLHEEWTFFTVGVCLLLIAGWANRARA